MQQEEWKSIPGTAGDYEISNHGRVRSWKMGNKKRRAPEPKIRKLKKHVDGTRSLKYSVDGQYYQLRVHQLVLELFVGPRPGNGFQYAPKHKDGDTDNNAVWNLEWKRRGYRMN